MKLFAGPINPASPSAARRLVRCGWKSAEDATKGKPNNAATGEMAGKLSVQGAMPLQFNAYKIPLMRNLAENLFEVRQRGF